MSLEKGTEKKNTFHTKDLKVVSRERARELDRISEERYSIPTILLMENAGRAVAEECLKLAEKTESRNFLVVAGSGNNGGDGFCAAKHIKNLGYTVKIALVQDEEKIKGDALQNFLIAKKMGIPIFRISSNEELEELLKQSDIVIDSIFGTGLSREIEDEFIVSVIKLMNLWRWGNEEGKTKYTENKQVKKRKIVSVDIPSGLDSNTGIPKNISVRADITVTFAPAKVGLFIGEFDRAGEVKIHDIGIPLELWENSEIELIRDIRGILRKRETLSHKGDFGHLLCVAGGVGRAGAAILAGKSALRVGAGLVTMMVPEPVYQIVASASREYMVFPAPADKRSFSEKSIELFEELVEGKTAVLVGPGIWNFDGVKELLLHIIDTIKEKKIPAVFDADALNILAEASPQRLNGTRAVITPHPGEAARMLGAKNAKEIQKDRIKHAVELSKMTGAICVLKGARTIITDGNRIYVNMSGGVELATGGTGDVLCGIIGGFLSQGYSVTDSAVAGTFIHGVAGKLAKRDNFPLSLADQVCEKIQDAISAIINLYSPKTTKQR